MAEPTSVAALEVQPRAETEALLKLTDGQLNELSHPPQGVDGEPITVNYRVTVFHVGVVDTRDQSACIKMGIVLYWTDPRMVGWTSPLLPPTLWGPELYLKNAIGGVQIEYEQFVVTDVTEGRMKRICNYEATVMVPMELHHFPFDHQVIAPEWVSISHWRQFDQARYGSLPRGQSYRLEPVERANEGKLLLMFFGGKICEWRLEACAASLATAVNPAGFTITTLRVQFHISRRYAYYITKVMVPLTVLNSANMLIHFIEPHLLADRIANIFTMFLAAYALLYVVGEHVPHVDVRTAQGTSNTNTVTCTRRARECSVWWFHLVLPHVWVWWCGGGGSSSQLSTVSSSSRSAASFLPASSPRSFGELPHATAAHRVMSRMHNMDAHVHAGTPRARRYVAVYHDGIGAGVTGAEGARRVGAGGTSSDISFADDADADDAVRPFPLAYALDIGLGLSLLSFYALYIAFSVTPDIRRQERERRGLEAAHNASVAKQPEAMRKTAFFYRLHEAPKVYKTPGAVELAHGMQRSITRRAARSGTVASNGTSTASTQSTTLASTKAKPSVAKV